MRLTTCFVVVLLAGFTSLATATNTWDGQHDTSRLEVTVVYSSRLIVNRCQIGTTVRPTTAGGLSSFMSGSFRERQYSPRTLSQSR